jgi:hypothetical protein
MWIVEVRTERVDGVDWVVKVARSPAEVARLRHETAQLRRAAHPGVVELRPGSHDDPGTLRTRFAGRPLSALRALPSEEICGVGAIVATTLADLHDIGITHGAVDADHVLIGPDGRPVLCGFGSSTSTGEGDPAADVCKLASLLADRLGADAPRRLTGLLQRSAAGRRRPLTARALAARLGDVTADRRLPDGEPVPEDQAFEHTILEEAAPLDEASLDDAPAVVSGAAHARTAQRPDGDLLVLHHPLRLAPAGRPTRTAVAARDPQQRRHVGLTVAVAAVAGAVALAMATKLWLWGASPSVVCPTSDAGCGPVPLHAGELITDDGDFVIDLRDPVVVIGRWDCTRIGLPAALDRQTGTVWAWRQWAARQGAVTATPVTTAPGARSLRVVPGAADCDRLEVVGPGRNRAIVRPIGPTGG